MLSWLVLLVLGTVLIVPGQVFAAEMVTNGTFNGSSSWTLSTATHDAAETYTGDGSGSVSVLSSGRNTQTTGTVTQAVTISNGSSIASANDIIAAVKHTSSVVTSSIRALTVALEYLDTSTVEVFFNDSFADGAAWSSIGNLTSTGFPLTLSQDVINVIVTLDAKNGNNAAAGSQLWADDISITYTAAAGDTTPPTISSTIPADSATGVAVNSQVTINWDEPILCPTVNTTNITISGSGGSGWALNSCSGSQAIFDTSAQAGSTVFTVSIGTGVTDIAGNSMLADSFLYLTGPGDVTPPTISSTFPTNGATDVVLDGLVNIFFNENIDCSTAIVANITSDSPGWSLASCGGTTVSFNTSGQANGTVYTVTVTTAVKDSAGNSMSAAYPFSYTTAAGGSALACNDCHGDGSNDSPPDSGDNTRILATGAVKGDHVPHVATYSYACTLCHIDNGANSAHYSGKINMADAIEGGWYDKDNDGNDESPGTDATFDQVDTPVTGRCDSTNCHGATNRPTWGTTTKAGAGCTLCHRSGTNDGAAANAYPTATFRTADAVGLHAYHLTNATVSSLIDGGIECADCHTVPVSIGAAGHISTVADRASDADPTFPAGPATLKSYAVGYANATQTCSVYCHDGTTDTDGTDSTPSWNATYGTCSSPANGCHGLPPDPSGGTHNGYNFPADCNGCHDTVNAGGTIAILSQHIDGTVQIAGCTGCHGGGSNEYPPLAATNGGPDGVGAHVAHIEQSATLMTKQDIGGATLVNDWCSECHTTSRGAGGHNDGYPAEVAFGNAVEAKYGGTSASISPDGGAVGDGNAGDCTVYCHGANMPNGDTLGTKRFPDWADTSLSGNCNTCHGFPPTPSGTHSGYTLQTQCGGCHTSTMTPAVAGITTPAKHINGTVEVVVGCTGCHSGGGPGAKLVSANSTHSNAAMDLATGGVISTCEDCHFDDHSSRGTGTVDIPWDERTMGTITAAEDALDSIIYLKGSGSEAEVCWSCHVTYGISEWNSTADTVASPGPRPAGYLSTGGPNWIGATWDSANFTYKQGSIASVHETQESTANPAVVSDDTDHAASPDGGQDSVADISCSACHDVHSIADGDTDAEPAPYLRGTWTSNPFPEDGAPQTTANATVWGGVPRAGLGGTKTGSTPNVLGGWQIEQNNPSAYTQVSNYATHSGLCASCHSQATLEDDLTWTGHDAVVDGFSGTRSNIFRTSIRGGTGDSQVRGHMQQNNSTNSASTKYALGLRSEYYAADFQPSITVNSDPQYGANIDQTWGLSIDDGTTDPDFHQFACSKCHDPHASRLPRLMITNCLDVVHNTWDKLTNNDVDDPSAWQGANSSTKGAHNATELAYSSTAVNCHRYVQVDDTDQESAGDPGEPGWNLITPW
jgi:predicted CxxxxCH...CXXCH cytochrome family protein